MIFGRTLVALSSDQNLILGAYVCIGVFKGIRTVFLPLIIPSYVDLKRLPAANGLSYLCNGLFSLICGPFLGKLKDVTGYRVTIHIMNSLGILALGIWLIDEMLCGRRKRTSEDEK
uniref:Major facilitator superfamily (MFS) profile domain-containing protein n=1 Tax=Megaselia scalaris TaxID=36166 RepID=T1GSU2_MEGSC